VGIKLPPLHHIAIAVEDIATAAQFYTSAFGMQWFPERETYIEQAFWKGEHCPFKVKVLYGDMQGVRVELVQTVEGKTTDLEFLRTRGQGVSHIGYDVSDLKAVVNELAQHGIKPISEGKSPSGTSFVFVDMGGVYAELVDRPQGNFAAALAGKPESPK
jgi:methylmalonyl-CoA/ethylmalonyl-CoA epimerase